MNDLIFVKELSAYIFKHVVEEWGGHNAPKRKWEILKRLTDGLPARSEKVYLVSMWDYEEGLIDLDEAEAALKTDEYWEQHSKHFEDVLEGRAPKHSWAKACCRSQSGAYIWIAKRQTHVESKTHYHLKTTYVFAASAEGLESILNHL